MADDALLRQVLAAGLLRIEQRLDRIEDELSSLRARTLDADAATFDQELIDALRGYFGGGPFTSGTVLLAAAENRNLADALAEVIDMNLTRHGRAVQLGKLLSRLPGLLAVGGRRGARMFRLRAGSGGL